MGKTIVVKIKCALRKWLSAKVIPLLVINSWRIRLYRLCGYNIDKKVFIGMRCYLDDVAPEMLTIKKNATISYGVFFACHGEKQDHEPIVIEEGAYIGVRATIISKNAEKDKKGVRIGRNSIVGACTLVNRDIPEGTTAVGVPCRILHTGTTRSF